MEISEAANLKFRQVNKNITVQKMKSKSQDDKEIEVVIDGITITGKVTSAEDGAGLPGVNIIIKGTTTGAVTGFDGKYELNAPADATLIFSFIGYTTQEVPVNNRSIIDVGMEVEQKSLEGVVVTAIGIKQQKKKLGYATQEVNTDVIDESSTMNLGNALSGQVAGLTVNNPTGIFQAPSFQLRGKTPLIVLDGVPMEEGTDLYDISPDDIESINVLKGGAASVLYGSRGKDGPS